MKKQARRLVYLFLALVLSAGIMGYPEPPVARADLLGGIAGGIAGLLPGNSCPTPVVTSIGPTYGTAGTVVQIDGSNFIDDSLVVYFGNVRAPNWNVLDSGHINATAPPAPDGATVDVIVANAGGSSATSSYDQFTYQACPTITSITPTSVPAAGIPLFVINGTNFQGATAVYFGTVPVTTFYVTADGTGIFMNAPPGTAGTTVAVTVVGPKGSSPPSNAAQLTYTSTSPPLTSKMLPINVTSNFFKWPTVTGINPPMGSESGGYQVTITGTNLTGATAVDFGTVAASNVSVNSNGTAITATSPAGTGTVDVTVTTPYGTSATSQNDHFEYTVNLTPHVSTVSPYNGPAAGGTKVTITGTCLYGLVGGIPPAVYFGSAEATNVSVTSDGTAITATSPAGTGTVDVTVNALGGTSAKTSGDQFTYTPAPTVTGISINSGPAAGGTQVTITGTNLNGATAVDFGTVAATNLSVNSAGTQITATSPAGTGTVDVTVTTPGGTSATSGADQFTYTTATSPPATGQTVMRFYIGNTDYYVNDQVQSMDTAPVIENERTLLPIRYVATPLGATVSWVPAAQKVTVSLNGNTIELWIGQNTAQVNGVAKPIDPNNPAVVPVIAPPGRTMLPLRFIAENLGCQVDWDQKQQMVTVTYPGAIALNPQPLPPG